VARGDVAVISRSARCWKVNFDAGWRRVGLHPVWIMFALLAGGSLLGFVGVLIAVPVAAVIGVSCATIGRYRESQSTAAQTG
jgi:predicted PurR-regulated permease PerM